MTKSVLVEATTKNSNATALLEVIVYVTNFAPYFKDGQPENQAINLDQVDNAFSF